MKKRLLVALAIMAVCLGVGTRTALADVVWQAKTSDHYMAVVYPMPYDFVDAKKRVLAEYVGYNYYSWSTTTRQAIEQGQGGNNPWTRAIEKVYNRAYDYGGGGGGHAFGDGFDLPFSNQIDIAMSIWGDAYCWDVDMTKADYDQLRAYIAYWSLPRFSPGTGTSTDQTDTQSVTLSHPFGKRYYGGSTTSWPTDGHAVSGTTVMTNYNPNMIQSTINSFKNLGCNYVYFVAGQAVRRSYGSTKGYGCVFGSASIITADFGYRRDTSGPDYVYIELTSESDIYQSRYGNPSVSTVDDNSSVLVRNSTYNGSSNIQKIGTTAHYVGKDGAYYVTYVNTNFDSETYVPTPDPPTTPVDVPEPQAPEPYTPDVPDPVDGTDVTDYLQAIIDALAEHCDHIRAALQDLETGINGYLYDLSEFWNEKLPTMIKDGLADVVHWLKLIYGRILSLATGRPAVDDDGGFDFFQWLTSLVTGFLGGLLGGLAALVSGLGQDASKLITKFPFSLPWDLYGILLLFEAIPQTPVVTLDWPLFNGETFHYVLDFTPWNDMMAICRDVERIVFAGMLIKLTPKFLGESEV